MLYVVAMAVEDLLAKTDHAVSPWLSIFIELVLGKGYKKGCKDCYEKNLLQEDNGDWIHDIDMEDQ